MLSEEQLRELSDRAIAAAMAAGEYIQSFAKENLEVFMKESGESKASKVVTPVDRKSQAIILEKLDPLTLKYNLGLLTEEIEDDGSRLEKDYFWCIDPLDGTLSFIEKKPGYAVSIALVSRQGNPMIGVVFNPLEGTLYNGIQGVEVRRNGELFRNHRDETKELEIIDAGGAVMNACWVIDHGHACFYKKPKAQQGGGCLWDYAAVSCIFKELGAWVSDYSGNDLELNHPDNLYMNPHGVIFASDEKLATKIMAGEVSL